MRLLIKKVIEYTLLVMVICVGYGVHTGMIDRGKHSTFTEADHVINSKLMNPVSRMIYLVVVCPNGLAHDFGLSSEIDKLTEKSID